MGRPCDLRTVALWAPCWSKGDGCSQGVTGNECEHAPRLRQMYKRTGGNVHLLESLDHTGQELGVALVKAFQGTVLSVTPMQVGTREVAGEQGMLGEGR